MPRCSWPAPLTPRTTKAPPPLPSGWSPTWTTRCPSFYKRTGSPLSGRWDRQWHSVSTAEGAMAGALQEVIPGPRSAPGSSAAEGDLYETAAPRARSNPGGHGCGRKRDPVHGSPEVTVSGRSTGFLRS